LIEEVKRLGDNTLEKGLGILRRIERLLSSADSKARDIAVEGGNAEVDLKRIQRDCRCIPKLIATGLVSENQELFPPEILAELREILA